MKAPVSSRFLALLALMPAYGRDREGMVHQRPHEANGRPGRPNGRRKDAEVSGDASKSVEGRHEAKKIWLGASSTWKKPIKPWACELCVAE